MGADKGKPACALPPRGRSLVEAGAKASVGVVDPVCLFFSCGQLHVSECKNRFYFNKNTYPGIIFPDRADASRGRLGGRGREQPSVGTSATGHGLHLSARETRLTGA